MVSLKTFRSTKFKESTEFPVSTMYKKRRGRNGNSMKEDGDTLQETQQFWETF